MERREFLAALGTAATISSASQVFAQAGGDGPQIRVALYVALEAKPGKEEAVAEFLRQGKALAEAELATIAWFGVRLGPSTFAIFDAFPDEGGRQAHLAGKVAAESRRLAGPTAGDPQGRRSDFEVAWLASRKVCGNYSKAISKRKPTTASITPSSRSCWRSKSSRRP